MPGKSRKAPRFLGPGHTTTGKQSRYDTVRLYQTAPEDIAAFISQYPSLDNRSMYITGHGYLKQNLESGPRSRTDDRRGGRAQHWNISPSKIGRFIASGGYNNAIQKGIDQFLELEYVDIHVMTR